MAVVEVMVVVVNGGSGGNDGRGKGGPHTVNLSIHYQQLGLRLFARIIEQMRTRLNLFLCIFNFVEFRPNICQHNLMNEICVFDVGVVFTRDLYIHVDKRFLQSSSQKPCDTFIIKIEINFRLFCRYFQFSSLSSSLSVISFFLSFFLAFYRGYCYRRAKHVSDALLLVVRRWCNFRKLSLMPMK